ncbi:MAG TPA: hypothetical protein VFG53_16225 [Anaeromyxobacter sp.]|nr:hypothetical protein [Anaeromyxobacter sp.]
MTATLRSTLLAIARLGSLVTLGTALLSCSQDAATNAAAQQVTVSVQPPSATTTPTNSVQFAAAVTGTAVTSVTWSVADTGGGTVDGTGLYTAPTTTGTFHVVATSTAVPTISGTATVSVTTPGSLDALLPADRRTLWQPGVTYAATSGPTAPAMSPPPGWTGGIPNRTTVCATLSPSGGDDTTAIQNAINACPANQVVKLNAGTFSITNYGLYMKSYVTLRGSGAGTTTLHSANNGSLVWFGTTYPRWCDQRNLTADATKGNYSTTVASTTGLLVGEVVAVDETYDSTLTWYNAAQGQTDDYLGYGECRCAHTDRTCQADEGAGCSACTTNACAQNQSRPIGQAMEIASISGNTVTFTSPFHRTYRTAHTARLARLGVSNTQPVGLPVSWAGVENLTVSNGGGTDDGGPLVFSIASYDWIKNVESTGSDANVIAFWGAFRCEARDSYIHSTTDPNPGGAGYGFAVDSYSADNLLENNISWNFNKVMVMRASGGGNVIAYNYMTDGWGAGYTNLAEVGINASHMTTPHEELFEGNESHNQASDTTWGNSIYLVFFRNHLTGLRMSYSPLSLTDQGNRRMAEVNDTDYSFSYVGNVLGCDVTHTCNNLRPVDSKCWCSQLSPPMPGGATGQNRWAYEPTADNDTDAKIWQFEYAGAATQATILRMGNWNWGTNVGQHWQGLGGAGTPDNPPNPLPAIPNSLYLTSKPSFFGSNPWPWVDPTTGTTYVLPARARFDAGTPNTVP